MPRFSQIAIGAAAASTLLAGAARQLTTRAVAEPAVSAPAATAEHRTYRIVSMRRVTEAQYRNSIADIFGPDIIVGGRFEPIVRPVHELIASGSHEASISPSGLEQFDAIGRGVAAQVFDDKHRGQFVPCKPQDPAKADPACAAAALTPLGRYLFRRPLTAAEQAAYVKMAGEAAGPTGSFYTGLEFALSAMLVSPNFLYIIEMAEPDPARPGTVRLDNYTRAARLSYTLWNTTPSESLLKAAAEGRLTDQAQLAQIAQHMVDSPRFEQAVRAFFADMLMFEKFDDLSKDSLVYPYYNQQVAQALPEQMLRTIVDHLVTRNGDYRQLFTTPRTFMTRSLGGLYQAPVQKQSGWQPYQFAPGDDRAGLLGQAGFLAIYSHPGRSSPTLRGRAIRELLLCQPVPNPPGNVNFTAVQDTSNKAMPTARIRLTAHMTDPECSGCHKLTDPIGLSLERFDGIGGFRATENNAPIENSGLIGQTKFIGASGLGKVLAASRDTTTCVASRALEYSRGMPSDDDKLVDAVEKRFAADGYTIRSLFLQVATMPQSYRVDVPELGGGAAQVSMLTK